jgi:WD40 repeat protein
MAVALGRIGGREVIIAGGDDRTVRVWDAASGEQLGEPLSGHEGGVNAVALGRIGGREVIVSGGADRTVRVWDAARHDPVMLDFIEPVRAIAVAASGVLGVATGRAIALLEPGR